MSTMDQMLAINGDFAIGCPCHWVSSHIRQKGREANQWRCCELHYGPLNLYAEVLIPRTSES